MSRVRSCNPRRQAGIFPNEREVGFDDIAPGSDVERRKKKRRQRCATNSFVARVLERSIDERRDLCRVLRDFRRRRLHEQQAAVAKEVDARSDDPSRDGFIIDVVVKRQTAVSVIEGGQLLAAKADDRHAERFESLERPRKIEDRFRARRDWSAMDWRADNPTGFAIARETFEALHAQDPGFGLEEALDYLDNRPDLSAGRTIQAA